MDADEVLRLKQNSGIPELFKNRVYSRSWVLAPGQPEDGAMGEINGDEGAAKAAGVDFMWADTFFGQSEHG